MDAVPELYDIVGIYLVLYFAINMLAAMPSIFIALKCNENLTVKKSSVKGYRWGYFTGFRLIFVYAFVLLWMFSCVFDSESIAGKQESLRLTPFLDHGSPNLRWESVAPCSVT